MVYLLNGSDFLQLNENIGYFLRLERLPRKWNTGILEDWFLKGY